MAQPLLPQCDPDFLAILEDVQQRLRKLFGTKNKLTTPLYSTSTGGMEACLANLLEAGDRIVVGVAGDSGEHLCEVARRIGAQITRVETEPGTILDPALMAASIERVRPTVVALVHGEASTGVLQPLQAIADAAHANEALVVLDCVYSLAGIPISLDDWGIDAAFSGTEHCLSCSPGLSPVSFSDRAIRRARTRRTPTQSWLLDLNLLADDLANQQTECHSVPISSIFALDESLKLIEDEGMTTRTARHVAAANLLLEGLAELGFSAFVDEGYRLPMLTSVRVPENTRCGNEANLRLQLFEKYGIEIGGGLGPLTGKIWRIGLMGENARLTNVEALLCALRHELG